jgi:DNA-binding FrmR family transcriptional regulator
VEIAKFILTAIGTFLSVLTLSFAVFQYWRKKQDEKFNVLKESLKEEVQGEREARKESLERLGKRIENLENSVMQDLQRRLSVIEGELKGIKPILQSIQNWFINNTPGGK